MKIQSIYQNNTLTFARALLALCFLLTLIFTPINDLFPVYHLDTLKSNISGLNKLNIFLWFENVYIPYFISIAILGLVISGYFPRYTIILQSWISYSIYYTMLITEGGDQINVIITFLLIPISILDYRLNGWRGKAFIKNKWLLYNASIALLFIQFQVAVLYLNAGISKIFAPEWANGTAVYYWFNDPVFGAPDYINYLFGWLFKNNYTVTLINWGVIFLELALFTGLFLKQKYKHILFILGFSLHFTIVLVHGLPTFWISMTGCLVLLLFNLNKSINENLLLIKSNIFKNEKK